jgi:hypothetical protein
MKRLCYSFVIGLAVATAAAAQEKLSYVGLVKRLTDLERLATLPVAGEQSAQWSSYDRKSRYDAATGTYASWDANRDGDGIIRKEGEQLVFAEMEGPGCIWRIWSAAPKSGHVRIYLDGQSEPAVDLPFVGYFDRKNEPFTRSALVHTVAMGWNNYTPIPYQKSCKIVADPGWGAYFHFNFETFPKGTQVPTFTRNLSAQETAALDEANAALTGCGPRQNGKETSGITRRKSTVVKIKGPACISGIRIHPQLPDVPEDRRALRETIIQIRWDGESEPSVWAPIGDFFGTAPGANVYRSLPAGVTEDGWWYCNWFMPFAKTAEITFKSEGPVPLKFEYRINTAPLKEKPNQYARFHAKWHRDAFLPTEKERWIDWPMVKTEGAGRFVGVMLHIWNPRGNWWGEGDEKFFVDGEKFPSTIGTGSEDYFGYAWCNPARFQNAYHNQTHNDGNNKGHVSVNRWHIADQIPFQKSFEGDIEKYFRNDRPTLYAATVYWYLAPGGTDPYRPAQLSERVGYYTNMISAKKIISGAIEGERLRILSKTSGNPHEQDLSGFTGDWSNDAHLWWIEAKPGDKLLLGLPVPKAGKYKVILQMTKARDYGIVQLWLDGRKLGPPVDLYNPEVVPSGAVDLGVQELPAGDRTLGVEIVGANEKAEPGYMFGLDYVKLQPVD